MTEKTIVECDGDHSNDPPAVTHDTNGAVPPDWGLLIDGDGAEHHLCPDCAHRSKRWTCDGVSNGDAFEHVQHNCLDIESLDDNVHATGGTLGLSLMSVVDEQDKFPEYSPPLGADGQDANAYAFHVFDHLHVYVIGDHKDEPHVVVDSDEFTTTLEVWDTEDSFRRVDLDADVSGVNHA